MWPTDYPVVTQSFGANPQIYSRYGVPAHEGLDIRALTNTNVYACFGGTVYEVHKNPKDHAYGIHIRIRHRDGYRTVYGHLARALVAVGEEVQRGPADRQGGLDGGIGRRASAPDAQAGWCDGTRRDRLPEGHH